MDKKSVYRFHALLNDGENDYIVQKIRVVGEIETVTCPHKKSV